MSTVTTSIDTDIGSLGLQSILVGSLPAALLTDAAPERYTVEAIFTRRADHDEVGAILGAETREFLSERGYPTIELKVSDRRLEIENTNLEELRDGLAAVLAELLSDISVQVTARRVIAAAESQLATELEHDRAAGVVRLAGSVVFTPGGVPSTFARDSQA